MKLDYYFDFISPFSYLLHEQLHRLPEEVEINHVPVLFAGLLKHWGSLGSVEIDAKKIFTYRHTTWVAQKLEVPFRVPDTHPFNPLPYLRLSIAMNNDAELVTRIFRAIWTTDSDPATHAGRRAIWKTIGIPHADELVNAPDIKAALAANTQHAISQGVFGVPSISANGELFWGLDSLDLLLDYLKHPGMFDEESMSRLGRID